MRYTRAGNRNNHSDAKTLDEALGNTFVAQEEIEAALQGSHSDREAMVRRLSDSGYNSHLSHLRGEDDYAKMVSAAKKAGKITKSQLEAVAQAMFKHIQPSANDQAVLRKILRENLVRSGVVVV